MTKRNERAYKWGLDFARRRYPIVKLENYEDEQDVLAHEFENSFGHLCNDEMMASAKQGMADGMGGFRD